MCDGYYLDPVGGSIANALLMEILKKDMWPMRATCHADFVCDILMWSLISLQLAVAFVHAVKYCSTVSALMLIISNQRWLSDSPKGLFCLWTQQVCLPVIVCAETVKGKLTHFQLELQS